MADPVLSANRQQPNGKPPPFSPCRHPGAPGGGGGSPFSAAHPELLPAAEPLDDSWPAGSPGGAEEGSPEKEGAVAGAPPPPDGPALASTSPVGADHNDAAPEGLREAGDSVGPWGPPEQPRGQRARAPPAGPDEERQFGKKKHRRRPSKKKRHWKPYYKLSWEEKKKFDEKQSQRASRLRAEMFAKGQPVAPYNTTQFLMEDHDQEEPDLKTGLCPKKPPAKADDTSEEDFVEEDDDAGSDGMGGEGSEFLQKDFSETYERYHVESLQNMSKQELIREYLELEKCLSRMEDENNRLRLESKKCAGDSEECRVRELEQELDRLKAENQKLLKENELCRQQEKPLSKAAAE